MNWNQALFPSLKRRGIMPDSNSFTRSQPWGKQPAQTNQPRSGGQMGKSPAQRNPALKGRKNSEQGAAEDDAGDGEINDEAGDVDEGGDEGGGGAGGVETETAENEWQHGADDGAEENHTNQTEGDGERDQKIMRTV